MLKWAALTSACYMEKSCFSTIQGNARLRGVCSGAATFPPYLAAHLDSNSGPLLHTHGQLCSILHCYSWFHSRKQPIPWHKLSSCISTQNWVLLQVSRKHTKAWTKLHLVSCWTVYFKEYNFFFLTVSTIFMKPLIKFCRNLWCFCFKNSKDPMCVIYLIHRDHEPLTFCIWSSLFTNTIDTVGGSFTWWKPRKWRSQSGRRWASHSLCCVDRGVGSWEKGWILKIRSHCHHTELKG